MPEDPEYQTILEEIPRGFVSRNALGECVGTHVNGVLGRNIKFSVVPKRALKKGETPTPEEQARIDEAKGLLDEWVEVRKLNQEYDKLGKNLLTDGIAYQRPFVPPGELLPDGTVPPADLATNMGRVYVHFPLAGEAVVYTDPRTQAKCSIYLYREIKSSRPSLAKTAQGDERAELTYLEGDNTIVRVIGADGTIIPEDQVDFSYPLGKRLLMADMQRPPLINEQVVSQQKLLNKTLTNMSRNNDLGGSREKITYNARMGGTLVTGADGVERFVADALQTGPARMLNLTGYTTEDALGNKTLSTPGMTLVDPVPVVTFLDTARSAYEAILAECKQLHTAAAGSTGISAESRLIAQAAYLIDLLQTKQQVDAGWAWLLETALALAAVLSGQPGRYDDLRVTAECSVDPGPISADMIRVVIELWREGRITQRTGLGWIGVEDVDGEIAGLEAEEALRAERFPETQSDERAFSADMDRQIAEMELAA